MARKKKHPEHVNHERWLISYADFITLLFAFFVVMFAVSQVDSKKMGRFTVEFSKAVGNDLMPKEGILPTDEPGKDIEKPRPPNDTPELPVELAHVQDALKQLAKQDESMKDLQVTKRRNELVLTLADTILFESGDDKLKKPAIAMIHIVAPELAKRAVAVRVEGYTDDRPIRTPRFRSNWELSTARATAVLALLADEGVQPTRLSAAGYGEFHPVVPNSSEEKRKQNRRVELVLSVATEPETAKIEAVPDAEPKKDDLPRAPPAKKAEGATSPGDVRKVGDAKSSGDDKSPEKTGGKAAQKAPTTTGEKAGKAAP